MYIILSNSLIYEYDQFIYIIIITSEKIQDLPKKAETLNPREVFKLFIKSVFYVGKGKQSRPYAHLFEASLQNKVGADCREGGRGVLIQKLSCKIVEILNLYSITRSVTWGPQSSNRSVFSHSLAC